MIDDIRRLLDGDFGDDRILKDIYRACKNGEVISNYERKYVRDLVARYLKDGARSGDRKAQRDSGGSGGGGGNSDDAEDDVVPDVVLDRGTNGKKGSGGRGLAAFGRRRRKQESDDGSVRLLASARKRGRPASRTKVVAVIGMVIVLLAVSVASIAAMQTGDAPDPRTDSNNDKPAVPPPAPPPASGEFSVRTDLARYSIGDFVSISGWSGAQDTPVSLAIASPQGAIVWSESVTAKPDGSYSTLVIAGGNSHWDAGGAFEVRAEAGDDSATAAFDVTP